MKLSSRWLEAIVVGGALLLSAQFTLAENSGFIDDMPPLGADASKSGVMIWEKPGLKRELYTKVLLEPVTIFISADSPYKGLSAHDLEALSTKFNQTIVTTLEPDVPVVTKAGPGVVYIRPALVDVSLAKKKRGLLGYTPVGLVVTGIADAVGGRISVKDTELVIEALDSVTGERLAVIVDKAPKTADGDKLSWDSIEKTFAYYADRFKTRLSAAQQAAAP